MDLLERCLSRKLLLVSGKGGIGKTLVTTALGLESASRGYKTCIVESSMQSQVASLLGAKPRQHELQELHPNLFSINLDSNLNFRDFIVLHLGFKALFDRVFTKSIVKSFIRMLPGIAEITLLGRLYYYHCKETFHNFDRIIWDGFASGHFLGTLKSPDAILNSGFVGPVIKETQAVRDLIADSETCGCLLVSAGEYLVLDETLDYLDHLRHQTPVDILGIMVNKLLPEVSSDLLQCLGDEKLPILERALQQKQEMDQFTAELRQRGLDSETFVKGLADQVFIPEPLNPELSGKLLRGEMF